MTRCPAASQVFHWCPATPDPWHGLLLPSWGPVPQPPAWAVAAREAAVSPWQRLLCTASHVVAGTWCPRYQSVLHHPQSLSPGWEQASHTQPGSGAQGSSLVIFHSGFLPRSGQVLPTLSPTLSSQPSFTHGGGRSAPVQGLTCPSLPCGSGPTVIRQTRRMRAGGFFSASL